MEKISFPREMVLMAVEVVSKTLIKINRTLSKKGNIKVRIARGNKILLTNGT